MFFIDITEYNIIKNFWSTELWPNRIFKHASSMLYLQPNKYDIKIYNNNMYYLTLKYNDIIIGTNSFFKSEENFLRSRGLWINKNYRGNNLSKMFFDYAINNICHMEKCKYIWSYPRKSAINSYLKNNFKKTSDWIINENNINCYILMKV